MVRENTEGLLHRHRWFTKRYTLPMKGRSSIGKYPEGCGAVHIRYAFEYCLEPQ